MKFPVTFSNSLVRAAISGQPIQDVTEEAAQAEALPRNWTDDEPGWDLDEHGYLTPAGLYADESGDDSPECWVWWEEKRQVGVVYTAREALILWWEYIQNRPIQPSDCSSCLEGGIPRNECPQSKRECGHHCNHAWSHEHCCWCDQEVGEEEQVAASKPTSPQG